ncbi:MAG: hypothetical protein ABSH48_17155 [Verrucomicrobiota bacterium]|jgi:hypothetical protein
MKLLSLVASSGLVLAWIIPAPCTVHAADSAASQPLQFKFELNHPLVFSSVTTTRTTTDRSVQLDAGNRSTSSTNAVETRYKLRLTPVRKSSEGVWTLHYEPFDFEEDLDTTAAGGHAVSSVHGLDVKSSQNGIVVVDTSKGVGLTQAKSFKQGVYSRMLNGYFDFQPIGVISRVDGDLPFIDYWTENTKYQVGFFDIVFPPDPVPAGGSWTKTLAVKDLEGIKLGDNGLVETNTFVRQEDPAATNRFIPVAVSMAVDLKNLIGSMDALGQNSMLSIAEFDHHKSGKFLFDPDAGCLTKGDENESLNMTMNLLVQGHTMVVTTVMDIHSKFDLLQN